LASIVVEYATPTTPGGSSPHTTPGAGPPFVIDSLLVAGSVVIGPVVVDEPSVVPVVGSVVALVVAPVVTPVVASVATAVVLLAVPVLLSPFVSPSLPEQWIDIRPENPTSNVLSIAASLPRTG